MVLGSARFLPLSPASAPVSAPAPAPAPARACSCACSCSCPCSCPSWFCPAPALVPCLRPCMCPCSCSCFCSCLPLHLLLLLSQLFSFLAVQEGTGTEQTASGLRVVAFLMCWTERSVWPAASTSATCSCTCRVHTVCLHAPLVSWDEETF